MEERLHVGVVVHLAGAVHALDDVVASQEGFEVVSGVFDAAVAVEDQARAGLRSAMALLKVWLVRAASRRLDRLQPTILRENLSMTTAK